MFSPMGANGAILENRARIYARLYQYAAAKWVAAGAVSHAVCLYAHDTEALRQFFRYGFGLRCVDAVRPMEMVCCPSVPDYTFGELDADRASELLPLKNMLRRHMGDSPAFMRHPFTPLEESDLRRQFEENAPRCFCAWRDGTLAAWLEVTDSGENFACDHGDMREASAAHTAYRSTGGGAFIKIFSIMPSPC